tara:strand:+ start:221 stop:1420 length:1200 start_codon:yes stop_codon:yes gene_type:complete
MSIFYVKNNSETAKEFFDKRMIYKTAVHNPSYKSLVDFNFAEKQLYGRVSRHYVPIVHQNYMAELVGVTAENDAPPLQAINFVVEAFNKMKEQFDKCLMANTISQNERFLSTLKVYKAYESPRTLYGQHIQDYISAMSENLRADKDNILNFEQLVAKVMPMLESGARKHPFTLSAYMKSTYCPMSVSGLVIEIADLKPTNDDDKINFFTNSLNWEYFLNACEEYGFMVDQLVPWRIVADIGSPLMLDYAKNYGFNNTDMILKHGYKGAHTDYLQSFKAYMLQLYNEATEPVVYEAMPCANGGSMIRQRRRFPYTFDTLSKKYDDYYFFNLYARIRFFEEESPFSDQEKIHLVDDCIEIARFDMAEALDVFERIVNKTFDYRGSLSYISERRQKILLSGK